MIKCKNCGHEIEITRSGTYFHNFIEKGFDKCLKKGCSCINPEPKEGK